MKYSNRIDAEGKFYPMEFEPMPTVPDMVLELSCAVAALVAFVCFIMLVAAL